MRLRDYLLLGGMTVLAAIATGCSNPNRASSRPDDSSNPKVVSVTHNDSIDNKVISTGNGNSNSSNGASESNGTGPDPLYQLVEETIKKYDEKGAYLDVEKKGDIEVYISLMGANLVKLGNEDLSGLSENSEKRLSATFNDYGLALVGNNQLNEAVRYLRIAINLDPDDERPHFNLAATLYKSGQTKDSWIELKEVLRINPSHQKALNSKRNLEKKYGFSD